MQKHCSHCTSIWGDITCREMTLKKGKFSCFCLNVDSSSLLVVLASGGVFPLIFFSVRGKL